MIRFKNIPPCRVGQFMFCNYFVGWQRIHEVILESSRHGNYWRITTRTPGGHPDFWYHDDTANFRFFDTLPEECSR